MKKSLLLFGVLLLLLSPLFSQSSGAFKQIDQWKHEGVFGINAFSFIDAQNRLVAGFAKSGNKIISRDKIIDFAPRGEGPDDITYYYTVFLYKGDLGFLERPEKIKIFTQKGETYIGKESKWLKRGPYYHRIKNGIFYDNKFFFVGMEGIPPENEPRNYNYPEYYYLKVYSDNGDALKQLIRKKVTPPSLFIYMESHVTGHHTDRVFVMVENELKVYVVSTKTLEIVKEVPLEIPPFYKKMPESFYAWKEYKNMISELPIDVEKWNTGYSSIQKIAVDGNYLVVQIRTPVEKMKKFALLFYHAETFKLERTVFLDDLLLDVKGGKYYCFANGNPGRDENTDECIINIYSFEEKK
jgi:hypothetical protein